ncbi:MAG: hypothetical protein PHU23_14425 [Dehalococcoidales bacterium]|nr:hypothetical protein [Dehalococcoidales bacterium]
MASKSKRGRINFRQSARIDTVPEPPDSSGTSYRVINQSNTSGFSYDSRRKEVIDSHPIYKYLFKELKWIGIVAGINLALMLIIYFILG